eukprot:6182008-Pleurochrysis_carterae.AAC.1
MLTGMPVSWHDAWKKLAFRFPRPHQPAESSTAMTAAAPASAANGSEGNAPPQGPMSRHELVLLNSVTGIDAPRREKRNAVLSQRMQESASALPSCRQDAPDVGELVFMALDAFESEFK